MTNIELALELQKLAVHLQEQPEVEIGPIELSCGTSITKEQFMELARVMPKPLNKRTTEYHVWLETKDRAYKETTDRLPLSFAVSRSRVCTLVEPAKPAVYKCEPLLSPDEESELESS